MFFYTFILMNFLFLLIDFLRYILWLRPILGQDQQREKEKNWPNNKKKKKAKRDSDRARAKTQVNFGRSFNRWRELWDLKGFKTVPELALFLPNWSPACNVYFIQSMEV